MTTQDGFDLVVGEIEKRIGRQLTTEERAWMAFSFACGMDWVRGPNVPPTETPK